MLANRVAPASRTMVTIAAIARPEGGKLFADNHLEVAVAQDARPRPPVDSGRHHHDQRAAERAEPVRRCEHVASGRR